MTTVSRRDFLAAAAALPATAAAPAAPLGHTAPPKFQLGLVTYNVAAQWDLFTVLNVCKEVGIAAVECRTNHKHGVEPTLKKDERQRVKDLFAEHGVVFWGCGSVCEFHSADKAVVRQNVETSKRFIDLVKDLGGTGVKVRPNGVAKGMSVEQACAQIGQALKLCGDAAADAGVEIWVEVHGNVTQLPANMKRIMDATDHPSVGITWNSNPTDLVDFSLDAAFDLLGRYIKSCHITDLTQDGKTYPYRALFNRLKAIGYDRYTLCEVGKSYPPGDGREFLRQYKALWSDLTK
jgi:sugar phosphate isomerase/epimerase